MAEDAMKLVVAACGRNDLCSAHAAIEDYSQSACLVAHAQRDTSSVSAFSSAQHPRSNLQPIKQLLILKHSCDEPTPSTQTQTATACRLQQPALADCSKADTTNTVALHMPTRQTHTLLNRRRRWPWPHAPVSAPLSAPCCLKQAARGAAGTP